MTCCTNSFPRPTLLFRLAFLAAILASGAIGFCAQTPSQHVDPFQKILFKPERSCTVPAIGEVTALVKNGVELSVKEDYDCDGVPDAYDNCVGMPNRDQADTNGNAVGDICEAAVIVKTTPPAKLTSTRNKFAKPRKPQPPAKSRSNTKVKSREPKAADKHSRPSNRRRRGR